MKGRLTKPRVNPETLEILLREAKQVQTARLEGLKGILKGPRQIPIKKRAVHQPLIIEKNAYQQRIIPKKLKKQPRIDRRKP